MSKCTICSHGEREEIDRALVRGDGLRALARRYGTSHTALFRHKRDHIPAELARVARGAARPSGPTGAGDGAGRRDRAARGQEAAG